MKNFLSAIYIIDRKMFFALVGRILKSSNPLLTRSQSENFLRRGPGLGAFRPTLSCVPASRNCSSKGRVQMATQTNLEQPTLVLRRVWGSR
jgi:hypothetical protein